MCLASHTPQPSLTHSTCSTIMVYYTSYQVQAVRGNWHIIFSSSTLDVPEIRNKWDNSFLPAICNLRDRRHARLEHGCLRLHRTIKQRRLLVEIGRYLLQAYRPGS
jgi:hypothetical protein